MEAASSSETLVS